MTDEERQKLVSNLHWYGTASQPHLPSGRWAVAAAKEIERLTKELERMRVNYEEENLSAQRQWTK